MKSKTLSIINKTLSILKEQGEEMQMDPVMGDPSGGEPEPSPQPETPPAEEMPLTSQAEEKYIKDLIDAALFEPSAEEARTLLNLQSVMELKRFKNAREEILPMVLSMISKETASGDIRSTLDTIE